MRRAIKQTLLTLAIAIGMTVGLLGSPMFTTDVHASGAVIGATVGSLLDKNVHDGSQSTKGAAHGGPCKERTGFFLTVTYAPDVNATPTQMGTGAILTSKGGYGIPQNPQVGTYSRIRGANGSPKGTAPWQWPAFVAGDKPAGYGSTIINWLKQEEGGVQRCKMIVQELCGVSAQIVRRHIVGGANRALF